jgi:hypothetical protein
MSTNRTAILNKIHKVLKKHYKPVAPPEERTVLEHMLYACCLENARPEVADEAFARLQENYFDWNEIRVTTVTELAETLAATPEPVAAAQRVKRSIQSVFESNYSFDLEALRKQNLGKAEKDLEKINGATPFVRAYITQNALGGHSIPISQSIVNVLYSLGVINDAEADKFQVPGIERAIPKNKGVEFGSLLAQVAADLQASPASTKLRAILAEIDPDYKDRLAARQARLESEAAAAQAAAKEKRQEARAAAIAAREAEAKKAPAKGKGKPADKSRPSAPEPAGDKTGDKSAGKSKPEPPAAKKEKPEPPKPAEKPVAKSLAKKKPK